MAPTVEPPTLHIVDVNNRLLMDVLAALNLDPSGSSSIPAVPFAASEDGPGLGLKQSSLASLTPSAKGSVSGVGKGKSDKPTPHGGIVVPKRDAGSSMVGAGASGTVTPLQPTSSDNATAAAAATPFTVAMARSPSVRRQGSGLDSASHRRGAAKTSPSARTTVPATMTAGASSAVAAVPVTVTGSKPGEVPVMYSYADPRGSEVSACRRWLGVVEGLLLQLCARNGCVFMALL